MSTDDGWPGAPGGGAATPALRLARPEDAERIERLMKTSARDVFPTFYDDQQTVSGAVHIAQLDPVLVEDRTYYVVEVAGEIVACGGWSRRHKLYTGSGSQDDDLRLLDPSSEPARVRAMFVASSWTRRGLGTRILAACEQAARAEGFRSLVLVATLPGVPLYRSYGFAEVEEVQLRMPDGVTAAAIVMERAIGEGRA